MESTYGQPEWSWGATAEDDTATTSSARPNLEDDGTYSRHTGGSHGTEEPPQPHERRRFYKSRTCRICLEVVEPTIEVEESATGLFAAKQRVRYLSEDPELGRLISPCKCKGSQKYVHEGCLQAWRRASPMSDRNYWKCPTCGFEYRIQRLSWGRWLQSKTIRVAATLSIFAISVFLLGFVADPIINFWLDPIGIVTDQLGDMVLDFEDDPIIDDSEPSTWSYHFLKGFLGLGLLGFLKSFFAMTPWQWFNVRATVRGNRRGGRDRLESINWGLVIVGIFTVLVAMWKIVSLICARTLEKLNDQIVDIHGEDPDDDDDDNDAAPNRT
ncbi:hypothetical protein GQ53DRAFT_654622 [Thozetella sp. PMI_491]|nr:hypothetical protein GQ53DRAFT_654622 [Thozetella sp. PMI_491]